MDFGSALPQFNRADETLGRPKASWVGDERMTRVSPQGKGAILRLDGRASKAEVRVDDRVN